MGCGDGN